MIKVFFAILLAQKAFSQDTWDWVRIDCGSDTSYKDSNGDTWDSDDDYIKTGDNKQVASTSSSDIQQLNTLRVFSKQNKNCYTVPTPTSTRYFVRAMFWYGNYDGLSKPPTFDLEFDGNKWATVVTNTTSFTYYEMIYATKGDTISICLARTRDQEFPFISRLESLPLPDDMYPQIRRDMAWFISYRYNYGADDRILGYPDDQYNRIWEPQIPPGLDSVTANFTSLDETSVNVPPDSAIIKAVEASATNTINLSFGFDNVSHLDHVEMYFTEPFLETSETRSFNITVNGSSINTTTPKYQICTSVGANLQSVDTLDIQLVPTKDSTLAPTISAIEVYTISQPLVIATTSQNDLDGLEEFIDTFDQLKGWSGDPCLPNDTIWQWLNCSTNQPPRVTSIYLSGFGLQGYLPNFSQMDALEIIDLHNNKLSGEIPDFLGKLPNLRLLDLRDNDFSGCVPQSITNNKQINYMIDENENSSCRKSKNAATIGSSIGSIILLALLVSCCYYCCCKGSKQTDPSPTEATVEFIPAPAPAPVPQVVVQQTVEVHQVARNY